MNICVVTGSRAEYGLLYWIMKLIRAEPGFRLQVVVTGMHLAPEFGSTWKEIEADGFQIDARVAMLLSGDDPVAVVKSTGLAVVGFADAFDRLRPDLVMVLGDRFEIMAATQAAMLMNIAIAHIHGGEITEGAIDESIRHAITKMSHVHFVAAEAYRRRVIQLGEQPDRVFLVGAPGLDNLVKRPLMTRDELEARLHARLGRPLFLVTYHPVTRSSLAPEESLEELLAALDGYPEAHLLITKANADAGGRRINQRLETYQAERQDRVTLVASLGQVGYLSALMLADLVIGNSSSGMVEAPSARKVTVNIGDRQKGRLRAPSVIDCIEEHHAIRDAIDQARSREYRTVAARGQNPYGVPGGVAERILNQLRQLDPAAIRTKVFCDVDYAAPGARAQGEW